MKESSFLNPVAYELYEKYKEKKIELNFLWNHINGVYYSYEKLYVVKAKVYERMRYSLATDKQIDRMVENGWEIVEEIESKFSNSYYSKEE